VVDDIDPALLESADVKTALEGFPDPSKVAEWDTPPPTPGNTETPKEKPDTYAETVFPDEGNAQETVETVSPNGSAPTYGEGETESELARFLSDPPEWFRKQAEKHVETGRGLNPLCSAVAERLYGDAGRWREVKPAVAYWLSVKASA
jgi:hypothetical protein